MLERRWAKRGRPPPTICRTRSAASLSLLGDPARRGDRILCCDPVRDRNPVRPLAGEIARPAAGDMARPAAGDMRPPAAGDTRRDACVCLPSGDCARLRLELDRQVEGPPSTCACLSGDSLRTGGLARGLPGLPPPDSPPCTLGDETMGERAAITGLEATWLERDSLLFSWICTGLLPAVPAPPALGSVPARDPGREADSDTVPAANCKPSTPT